jgi:hypothetical protein
MEYKQQRGVAATAALFAAVLSAAVPAASQVTPAGGGTAPDVQVVAIPLPTGEWAVSSVYNGKVPRAEAQARQQSLAQLTGWRIHDVTYEDRGLGLQRRDGKPVRPGSAADADAPTDRVLTSVSFQTPAHIVDFSDGTVDVSPWARAFRDKERVHLTFLLPPGARFSYRGLRHYAGPDLQVDLAPAQPGALTYVLQIKNHQMGALTLPRYQEATDARTLAERKRQAVNLGQRTRVLGTSLIVLFALGAGVLVYLWATRLSNGRP